MFTYSLLTFVNFQYYNQQASENKLAHLRNLRDWAGDQGIQFSRRPSVLASRLYTKHQREQQQAKVKTGPAKRAWVDGLLAGWLRAAAFVRFVLFYPTCLIKLLTITGYFFNAFGWVNIDWPPQ